MFALPSRVQKLIDLIESGQPVTQADVDRLARRQTLDAARLGERRGSDHDGRRSHVEPEIDKNRLYGRYQRREDQRGRLALRVAHKALDIPDDEMHINANRTGIGAKGAIGVALAAGLPGVAVALSLLGSNWINKPAVPPTANAPIATITPTTPAEREYELRWELRDGKLQQTIEEVKPNE